jgi:hypothetical protein
MCGVSLAEGGSCPHNRRRDPACTERQVFCASQAGLPSIVGTLGKEVEQPWMGLVCTIRGVTLVHGKFAKRLCRGRELHIKPLSVPMRVRNGDGSVDG